MKRNLLMSLLAGAGAFVFIPASAQLSVTDNAANFHNMPVTPASIAQPTLNTAGGGPCSIPVTSDAYVCDSGAVTLSVSNGIAYGWFAGSTGGSPVATGSSFSTPMISTTTSYYVESYCNPTTAMMPLPAQAGSYGGNIRGYFFTAPVAFTIVGLRVPTDADPGAQTIEILRFNSAGDPPAYPGLTNTFTSLGYWNGVNTTTMINTNIQVNAGDVIGIYGWRGTTDSYSSGGSFVSNIAGFPVTLERSGMQYDLNASQMFDVWSEPGGAISRTEMYYSTWGDTSVRVMSTVNVNQSQAVSQPVSICTGDSIFAQGAYQMMAGTYRDTLQTMAGCDSVVSTVLTVNAIPSVSVAAFSNTTICLNDGAIALPAGSPSGGSYTVNNASVTTFDPAVQGSGTFYVVYSYQDANSCGASDSTAITVDLCTSIDEYNAAAMEVYPNPATDHITVKSGLNNVRVQLVDAAGRLVAEEAISNFTAQLDLSVLAPAKGVYMVKLVSGKSVISVKKLVRL
jgi:hypothetical protein